jgi:hypothetical protein
MQTDRFAQLAQLISDRCFHGCMPAAPVLILEAVIKTVPVFQDVPEEAAQYFADKLFAALCRQIGEDGARLSADMLCEENPRSWVN